jgi:hypothetical protein
MNLSAGALFESKPWGPELHDGITTERRGLFAVFPGAIGWEVRGPMPGSLTSIRILPSGRPWIRSC